MDWSYANPLSYLPGGSHDVIDGTLTSLGLKSPKQPGVGGPLRPEDAYRLQQDPQTGLWHDPVTGQTYLHGDGQTPVQNPNVAQQVASNFNTGRGFLGNLDASRRMVTDAGGGLRNLASNYQDVLSGRAASVAQNQLRSGLESIAAQQMSGAAGVGGNNAFAARRAALGNIAGAQGQYSQQAALLRAQEQDRARAGMGQAYSALGTLGHSQYGTDADAALGFAREANSGQQAQQGLNQSAADKNAAGKAGLIGSALGLISDVRAKERVRPAKGLAAFLDTIKPASFRYKGEKRRRTGVVIQDIERSDVGRELVEERGDGMKTIPLDQGLGAALAALGDVHARVKRLESR